MAPPVIGDNEPLRVRFIFLDARPDLPRRFRYWIVLMRYGTQKNYPIVRSGLLSAVLDEPLKDEDGKEFEAYLAEVRSIGGCLPPTPPKISKEV